MTHFADRSDSEDDAHLGGPVWTSGSCHAANKYIGRAWVAGSQGPDVFDCWGFVRWVLEHEYGVKVPCVNVNPDNLRDVLTAFKTDLAFQAFKETSIPKDGDVVLLRQAKNYGTCFFLYDSSQTFYI